MGFEEAVSNANADLVNAPNRGLLPDANATAVSAAMTPWGLR